MSYEPHDDLIAPARATANPAILIAGVLTTGVLFYIFSLTYGAMHQIAIGDEAWVAFANDLQKGATPLAVLINLYIFALLIAALTLTMRMLHARSLVGLIGPSAMALWQFRRVIGAILILYLILMFAPVGEEFETQPNLAFSTWILLLPLGLLGLVIQTAAEELVFRGYIQSQLAARYAHPAIWMGVPAVLFAFLHYDPASQGDNALVVVAWAGLFSIAASDLTARSGTLGPAIAMHLVNNVGAILFSAPMGSFDGLALYVFPFSLNDDSNLLAWAPVEFLLLFCSWLAARIAIRR